MKLQAFDSNYFHGKSHFGNDRAQNYLVYQPICRCYKKIGDCKRILGWK